MRAVDLQLSDAVFELLTEAAERENTDLLGFIKANLEYLAGKEYAQQQSEGGRDGY